jgi:zinc protease
MFIKINRLILLGLVFFVFTRPLGAFQEDKLLYRELLQKQEQRLHMQTLENGMRVVCYVAENTNQVTVGVAVNVGFKDETDAFGLAHILEHMLFKGTRSHGEGYIDDLARTYGLSKGDCNAYTTYDHTFYFFNTDSKNWPVFGDVVADLLQNLEVSDEALNSELSAIVQEIKRHECDQNALGFADMYPYNHPYSHAGIGYKEQILSYTAEDVMDFYKKHYVADKATLFVCGKVNPAEVFEYARQTFGLSMRRSADMPAAPQSVLPFYAGLSSTVKTIYHPQLYRQVSYIWQGAGDPGSYDALALEYFASILSKRLKHKWIDEQGMCFGVSASHMSLQHAGAFSVYLQPKEAYYTTSFDKLLTDEIASLIEHGITAEEFSSVFMGRIQRLVKTLEYPKEFLFNFVKYTAADDMRAQLLRSAVAEQTITPKMVLQAARVYLRPSIMNAEIRLPLESSEVGRWEDLQKAVQAHETHLLNARSRDAQFQHASKEVSFPQPQPFEQEPDVEYHCMTLSNGLSVYFHQDVTSDSRVFCLLHKDAFRWMMTKRVTGATSALNYWGDLLLHGNRDYTKKQLDEYCRTRGIALAAGSYQIFCTALKNNFDEALRLLRLSLDAPLLPQEILERWKAEYAESIAQAQNDLQYRFREYLDRTWRNNTPGVFSAAELLTQSNATTIDDIQLIINEMRDPRNLVAVLVGDCTLEEAQELAEKHFGTLQGDCISAITSYVIPPIIHTVSGHIEVANENSYVSAFCATCLEDTYDTPALVLLREYLESRLFDVRERTGLFYSSRASVQVGAATCLGSVSLGAVAIPANISRISAEIEQIIAQLYTNGVSHEQLQLFKENHLRRCGTYVHTACTLVDHAAGALAALKEFTYTRQFNDLVQQVTLEQINEVIKKYFDPARWSFVTVGRA